MVRPGPLSGRNVRSKTGSHGNTQSFQLLPERDKVITGIHGKGEWRAHSIYCWMFKSADHQN